MKSNPVKSKKTKTESKVDLNTESVVEKEKKPAKPKKTSPKKTNLEGKLSEIPLKEKKTSVSKPKEKLSISPETKKILKEITNHLKEKKCEDIVVMNLEEVNSYLSLFVIATVSSHTQGKAVARDLEKKMKVHKLGVGNTEKKNAPIESGWTLLDLGEIVVHIMTAETRAYYDLDKLWGDAKKVSL